MRKQRGFSMIEIAVAAAVLGALLIVVMQLTGAVAGLRRAASDRRLAIEEAANVMERLFVSSWEDLAARDGPAVPLSDHLRRTLSECRLEVQITVPHANAENQTINDAEARRILVVVSWLHHPRQPRRSARLVAFRYRAASGEESEQTESGETETDQEHSI